MIHGEISQETLLKNCKRIKAEYRLKHSAMSWMNFAQTEGVMRYFMVYEDVKSFNDVAPYVDVYKLLIMPFTHVFSKGDVKKLPDDFMNACDQVKDLHISAR